jgi:Fe-S-cluster containining protein
VSKADLDRPSTWSVYRDGDCVGCRALCCSLPVVVTPNDLVRLGVLPQERVMDSPRRIAKDLGAAGIVAGVTPWERTFLLGKKGAGTGKPRAATGEPAPCIYLGDDRRCGVYEKRPDACREFPAVGPRPGACPKRPGPS